MNQSTKVSFMVSLMIFDDPRCTEHDFDTPIFMLSF